MSDPVLTLLTAIIAALGALGAVAAVWPASIGRIMHAAAALAALGSLLCLVFLVFGWPAMTLPLPLGLPGADFGLTLDPLSAFFTAMLLYAGAAICLVAAASAPATAIAALPIALAAFGFAVLGAGGIEQATGLAVAGGAIRMLQPADKVGAAPLAITLLAAAAVAVAADAPAPALIWAALLGPGALAGLAPLHHWMGKAHGGSPSAAALLSGVASPVAVYILLRLLFAHAATVPPSWWGLVLLVLGAASVLAGGLDAARQPELDTAIAATTVWQAGLIAIGLGIALIATAADLPDVTAMALGAVLLLAVLQALCGTLLALAAAAIRDNAGTRRLDRLGGVIHRMPATTSGLLAALFGLAALPPSAGFAAIWLLFHALLGLPHSVSLWFRLVLCALAAVLGLAAALGAANLLRLVGVVCLGRPRTPRAAVAEEQPRMARSAVVALAAGALGWGVLCGPLLHLLADAPVRTLVGVGLGTSVTWGGLVSGAESPGYGALPLTLLLAVVAAAVLWLRRRRGARTPGVAAGIAAWNDGFAAAPAWLPFGDPATQTAASGFVPKLPPIRLPRWHLPVIPPLRVQAVVLIAAALLLAAWAWTAAP